MAFTKVFGTADGAYSTATNWKPIDVTNPNYAWTASGSGTNEYYLRTAGGANPGFVSQPDNVYINGSNAAEGTMGSLTTGQWDYGDNDSLGYSTIYVRLSDGSDPDTKDPFYVKFYQAPTAGENVRFAADSASVNSASGLDQSGVAIADFIVEQGYAGTIGSADIGYLYIDPDRFEFNGSGECWIDIGSAAIGPQVYGTAAPNDGERGLYLRGSAISVLNVTGGSVGLASRPGETSTATTIRVLGSETSLWIGNGVTLTNLNVYGGNVMARGAVATTILYDGTIVTAENGAMTTVTMHGGEYDFLSTGTITTFNWHGGTLDEQKSGAARTITTMNLYRGAGSILRNKEAVTWTNFTIQDSFTLSVSI